MFLPHLQQDTTIISRNLRGDEFLAPEKFCTILFGTSGLKITMKRQGACCVCQDYSRNFCPSAAEFETAGWRLHTSGLRKKTANMQWKTNLVKNKTVLFRYGTKCCLLYQRASLRYQQICTACFTEKQRDLSIPMPP